MMKLAVMNATVLLYGAVYMSTHVVTLMKMLLIIKDVIACYPNWTIIFPYSHPERMSDCSLSKLLKNVTQRMFNSL